MLKNCIVRKLVVSLLFVTLLASCGGGHDDSGNAPPPSPVPASSPGTNPTSTTAKQISASYADVVAIDLADVGMPRDTTPGNIKVVEGNPINIGVYDGQIRFITPSDPGTDSTIVLTVSGANGTVQIPIVVATQRPLDFAPLDDGGEETDEAYTPPALTISGLDAGNVLGGKALVLGASGAPPLDFQASTGYIKITRTSQSIDFTSMWTWNAADNTLQVSAANVQSLLSTIPGEELELWVSLVSQDGSFATTYSGLVRKPGASLTGHLIDVAGKPVTSGQGKLIGIRGSNTRTRLVASVESDGSFAASGLPVGTYEASVLDVAAPGLSSASFPIYAGTDSATVNIVVAPTTVGKFVNKAAIPAVMPHATRSVAPTTQNGTPPVRSIANGQSAHAATPSTCEMPLGMGASRYTVIAGQRDATIICNIAHIIPKGTSQVAIQVTVSTAEYPVYTEAQSQFNDSWGYAISGLPGAKSASGLVNDSHYAQGSVTNNYCLDAKSIASNGDAVLSASINTTNIGDSQLATSVVMDVALMCDSSLKVVDAQFTSPNSSGFDVIEPKNTKNGMQHYISVPNAGTDANAWGIPLTITYEPQSAVIQAVRLGFVFGGGPKMVDSNVIGQASQSPGKLVFNNLLIPRPTTPFAGKTSVVVELSGTIDGQQATSDPSKGQIAFKKKKIFVPLFLAGEQLTNRFGVRDAGGDSWATDYAITWLKARQSYPFNDVSALHIAQYTQSVACPSSPKNKQKPGDSVLCHKGHSNGSQIDLRYADGAGGFSGTMNGSNGGKGILATLNAAKAEVAAGATAKPNLALVVSWIAANRKLVETEIGTDKTIFLGPEWIEQALQHGRFPDSKTQIEGVSEWKRPARVSYDKAHKDHWHISLPEQN